MQSECPTPQQLRDFAADPGGKALGVDQAHLNACDRCRELLDSLAGETSHWRHLLDSTDTVGETRAALERISARFLECQDAHPLPKIDGYTVEKQIGYGGAAIVYRALQHEPARAVALKALSPQLQGDAEARARFKNEARAIAKLRHPGIVPVYDVGESHGTVYFTMPLYELGSLSNCLGASPVCSRTAARLVQDLAAAVAAAHAGRIVHRDLKPENVLISQATGPAPSAGVVGDGVHLDNASVHISDFGIAKQTDAIRGITRTGDLIGTPDYMAPEQVLGRPLGPACDIFALGAILYRLMTGRTPFESNTPAETLLKVVHEEPVAPRQQRSALPADLVTICLKCLEKAPRERYDTAQSLADDLGRYLAGQPVMARPVTPLQTLTKWATRRPYAAALIGVSCLALLALVGMWGVMTWQLKAQRDQIQATARQLEREKDFAVGNFDRAHQAIQKYLASVRTGVNLMTPEMQPVRESLLTAGIEFYDDLLRDGGDHETLRAEMERLTQAHVERAQLHLELGRLLSYSQRHEEAVNSFAHIVEICDARPQDGDGPKEPDFARLKGVALLSKGECLRQLARSDEAVPMVRDALTLFQRLKDNNALDPGYQDWYLAEAWQRLARLLSASGREHEAIDAIDQAIRLAEELPPIPDYKYAHAQALLTRSKLVSADATRFDDLEAAAQIMDRVCSQTVGNAKYDALQRRILEELGQQVGEPEEVDAEVGKKIEGLIREAQFATSRWDHSRAIARYGEAISWLQKESPTSSARLVELHFQMGIALFAVSQYEESLEHFRFYETSVKSLEANVASLMARCFAEAGDIEQTKRYLPAANVDVFQREDLHGAFLAPALFLLAVHESDEATRAVWCDRAAAILHNGIQRRKSLTGQQLRSLAGALAETHAMLRQTKSLEKFLEPAFGKWSGQQALLCLEQIAVVPRSAEARFLANDVRWQHLHADPRFQAAIGASRDKRSPPAQQASLVSSQE